MKKRLQNGLSMASILVLVFSVLIVGVVLAAMAAVLDSYESSTVRSAQTSSRQAVDQVANTVSSYVDDMHGVMDLLERTLEDSTVDRDGFFQAFLSIRPDVVAVTTYDPSGALQNCWALDHVPRETVVENLSFDPGTAREGAISQPHVASIFEGWYPWVVTMLAPIQSAGAETWVALDLSFDSISAYINNVGIGQHGYCFLMDEAGAIIYHPQQQLIYSDLKQEDTTHLVDCADGVVARGNAIYAIRSV